MSPACLLENSSQLWIPTPMAQALHERLEQWIQCGHTGGLVLGEARVGKTRAIKSIGGKLTNRSGQPIHLFYTHYGLRDQQTVRAVFAKLAKAIGFDVARQSSDTLFDWIVMRLSEAALANDTRQVVLIVDEAQQLTMGQLNAYAEIYNDLFENGINFVVIFVANLDQFEPMREGLLRRENRYLRERFFVNLEHFYGIRSERDLAACLKSYDQLRVDEQRPQSAVEYFCPALAEAGWHLESLAPIYWRQFRERYGIKLGMSSWGMAQFVRATNLLVMDYLPYCTDKDDWSLQEASVIKSLDGAGIEPSLVSIAGFKT